jgi:hypothetical protein
VQLVGVILDAFPVTNPSPIGADILRQVLFYCSCSETVSTAVLLYSLNLILKRSAMMALHSLYGKLPGTSQRQS